MKIRIYLKNPKTSNFLGFSFVYEMKVISEPRKVDGEYFEYEVEMVDKYLCLLGKKIIRLRKGLNKEFTGRFNIKLPKNGQ